MEVNATLKTYRQSPRKVRLLAKVISGDTLEEAKVNLSSASKRVAPVLLKLLKSAEANASDRGLDTEKLFVSSIRVDEGPTLFRMMPRAHGKAFVIRKRTSHIKIVLAEKVSNGLSEIESENLGSKNEKEREGDKKTKVKKTVLTS